MKTEKISDHPPYIGVLWATLPPILVGGIFAITVDNLLITSISTPLLLIGIGLMSLWIGLRSYGAAELGLRGGRPLMSGLSFAFLGWIGLLIARFTSVGFDPETVGTGLGITYLYLLIIPSICVQLWIFGLIFRAISEWRSPIAATWISGILFGLVGHYLFSESYQFIGQPYYFLSVPWHVIWGIFYGIVRLRTGSWIGIAIIQALQTLTVWHILPATEIYPSSLPWLYGISGVIFILITWRLVPKYKSDLRV